MTTITIDLLNENAITLLRDMELLKLIRLRRDKKEPVANGISLVTKYKGAMLRQPTSDIDQQLNNLRSEWE